MTERFFTTGDIAKLLGFALPAAFIRDTLNVAPAKKDKAAFLWTYTDVINICTKLEQRAVVARMNVSAERKNTPTTAVVDDDDEL